MKQIKISYKDLKLFSDLLALKSVLLPIDIKSNKNLSQLTLQNFACCGHRQSFSKFDESKKLFRRFSLRMCKIQGEMFYNLDNAKIG